MRRGDFERDYGVGFMGDIFQSGLSAMPMQLGSGEALRQANGTLGNGSSQAEALEMHEMLHGIRGLGAQGQSQLIQMDHQLAQAQGGQLRNVIAPYLDELIKIVLDEIDELKRKVESFSLLRRDDVDQS